MDAKVYKACKSFWGIRNIYWNTILCQVCQVPISLIKEINTLVSGSGSEKTGVFQTDSGNFVVKNEETRDRSITKLAINLSRWSNEALESCRSEEGTFKTAWPSI
mgnify:CR=1 FL=1